MSENLKATEKVALGPIEAVDAKGNPAPLDGAPEWASSDESILAVTASEDGLSATVVAVGPVGAASVTCTGDARMGEEVVPAIGTVEFVVGPGEAVAINIPVGAPEPQ